MKQILACALSLSLLFFCSPSDAQSSEQRAMDVAKMARAVYSGSSTIPDGVAFRIFLISLNAASQEDPSLPIDHWNSRLGLDREAAADLVELLLAEFDAMNEEIASFKRTANCSKPSAYTEQAQVYALFDALDDGVESITERRYSLFKSRLSPDKAALLRNLVDFDKPSMTYIKFDHKKLYESQNRDALAKLTDICARYRSQAGGH